MAIINVSVIVNDGVDEDAFISYFDDVSEVELDDKLDSFVGVMTFNIEDSYMSTLESHSSVKQVEKTPTAEQMSPMITYPSEPTGFSTSNIIASGFLLNNLPKVNGQYSSAGRRGYSIVSATHFYDADEIQKEDEVDFPGSGVIANPTYGYNTGTVSGVYDDDVRYYVDGSDYSQRYTGKHVDIVLLESATTPSTSENHGDTHYDFTDPDDGSIRAKKHNWGSGSNQLSGDPMFSDHGIRALSCAIGRQSGFAKKANGYITYISSTLSALQGVKSWHDSKGINSATGLKNPTIAVFEAQYVYTFFNYAIKVDDIISITNSEGTVNRPGSSWGNDLSPFVKKFMIPRQMQDPSDNSWNWVIPFNKQGPSNNHRYQALKTIVEQCWDAGITVVDAGGNYTFVYSKEADEESTYCTLASGTNSIYEMDHSSTTTITSIQTTTTTWYPHYNFSAAGLEKCVSIAAGDNSETNPILAWYTARGPGVNLISRAFPHFCAGYSENIADEDGFKWGSFSGNSCAMPVAAGKLACIAEKYYVKNGVWPTPTQLKTQAILESRADAVFQDTINWTDVSDAKYVGIGASTTFKIMSTRNNQTSPFGSLKFFAGSYYFQDVLTDRAGTPNQRCFLNNRGYNRENTYKKRPLKGVLYPRPRRFDIDGEDTPTAKTGW